MSGAAADSNTPRQSASLNFHVITLGASTMKSSVLVTMAETISGSPTHHMAVAYLWTPSS